MLKFALINSSWYASRGSTENVESVETRNKNKQRIKTNQCAPGWARNSVENRRNPVFLCYSKDMNLGALKDDYDQMQAQYGAPHLHSIYFGGCVHRPKLCLVFMNPTARNIATRLEWPGIRAPWVGTKNVWNFFARIGVISSEIHAQIQAIKGTDWTPEFAQAVYNDVARRGVFITNLAKCAQIDARPLPDAVFEQYRAHLLRELQIVQPKDVVLFGNQVSSIILRQKISVSQCRQIKFAQDGQSFWPVFYPVGNGFMNIDKAVEDVLAISDNQ